ncbi:uncharacterized protein LOC130445711 isoform X1 [Diorhabda sublineata]|uniref:uncharacterized protein LOC130445711 isoform X1 n=1 Tax=Diorhabda sublineata TaxID=1163346 RepID=UPI0024E140A7|nr:uncharacterized protein LOC130445711 isoform X1 [Diorhabda sublineata]
MELKKLDSNVINQTRSSFLINNFCQGVVELVLNSLDAKSTSIAVRLNLITLRIQVVDNGEGITRENLELVGLRYYTNKCKSLQDLQQCISYYGFRGEALANLIELSKAVHIDSRHKNCSNTYTKIMTKNECTAIKSVIKERPSFGTTVTVDGLFQNYPVRKNRIINELELEEIVKQIKGLVIMHHDINFSVRNDVNGELILTSSKTDNIVSAFKHLHPDIKEIGTVMKITKGKIKIKSMLFKSFSQNKRVQYIFVNKRPVISSKINKCVHKLFQQHSKLKKSEQSFPVYVLNIKCPYTEVNISCNATKTTVEFKNCEKLEYYIKKLINSFFGIRKSPLKQIQQHTVEEKRKSECGISQIQGLVRAFGYKRKHIESDDVQPRKIPKNIETNQEEEYDIIESTPFVKKNNFNFKQPLPITIAPKEIKSNRSDKSISIFTNDENKGKHLIMNMFLKSTQVYKSEEDIRDLSQDSQETIYKEESNILMKNNVETMFDGEKKAMSMSVNVKSTTKIRQSKKNVLSKCLQTSFNKNVTSKALQTTLNEEHNYNCRLNDNYTLVLSNEASPQFKFLYKEPQLMDNFKFDLMEMCRCTCREKMFDFSKLHTEKLFVQPKIGETSCFWSIKKRPKVISYHKWSKTSPYFNLNHHQPKSNYDGPFFDDLYRQQIKKQPQTIESYKCFKPHYKSTQNNSHQPCTLENNLHHPRIQEDILHHKYTQENILYHPRIHEDKFHHPRIKKNKLHHFRFKENNFHRSRTLENNLHHPRTEEKKLHQPRRQENNLNHPHIQEININHPRTQENQFHHPRTQENNFHYPRIQKNNLHQLRTQENNFHPPRTLNNNLYHSRTQKNHLCQPCMHENNLRNPRRQDNKYHQSRIQENNLHHPGMQEDNLHESLTQDNNLHQHCTQDNNLIKPRTKDNNLHQPLKQEDDLHQQFTKEDNLYHPCKQKDTLLDPRTQANNLHHHNTQENNLQYPRTQENNFTVSKSKNSTESFGLTNLTPCGSPSKNINFVEDAECKENENAIEEDMEKNNSELVITLTDKEKLCMLEKDLAEEKSILMKEFLEWNSQFTQNESLENDEGDWIKRTCFGRRCYLNKQTGFITYSNPKINEKLFVLSERYEFLPKGMSPILKEIKPVDKSLSQNGKETLSDYIMEVYKNELLYIKWQHYLKDMDSNTFFENLYKLKLYENCIPNIVDTKKCDENGINFTRDLFTDIQIIGQLDKKFIIANNENMIIVFDQHAVHERIRLERLSKIYKNAKAFCEEPVLLFLPQNDISLLKRCETYLNYVGISLDCLSNCVRVIEIPLCVYIKYQQESVESLNNFIKIMINEVLELLKSTRAATLKILPRVVQNIVNLEACRGAIKFGDYLNKKKCTDLLQKLSLTELPFQCAHGRPTVTPLIRLDSNSKRNKVSDIFYDTMIVLPGITNSIEKKFSLSILVSSKIELSHRIINIIKKPSNKEKCVYFSIYNRLSTKFGILVSSTN